MSNKLLKLRISDWLLQNNCNSLLICVSRNSEEYYWEYKFRPEMKEQNFRLAHFNDGYTYN
jgi:hypothetical protein